MTAYDHLMFTLALLSVLMFFGLFVVYIIHLMNQALKDFRETQEREDHDT